MSAKQRRRSECPALREYLCVYSVYIYIYIRIAYTYTHLFILLLIISECDALREYLYGVRALAFYGNLREQTGEDDFP